jgi:putative ABC transport system permease protein
MLFYDAMRFDILLTSKSYFFEGQPFSFPRRRLYQALSLPEVVRAMPVYHNIGRWLNAEARLARDVFVVGFNPSDPVFNVDHIERQTAVLRYSDIILVDVATKSEFGPIVPGRRVEIEQRAVTIGGVYDFGTRSRIDRPGVILTSDLNFVRIFKQQQLSEINLGLVLLNPGADQNEVAARLRSILPPDTRVFTRKELAIHETAHWVRLTSIGLIFGFGTIIAVVVGSVLLNQTLTSQVRRNLPQYATLKAMGYSDHYLVGIVVVLGTIMVMISYVPAVVTSILIYSVIRRITSLPAEMTIPRLIGVLSIALTMSVGSALLSLRTMRRADPADLF